MTQVDKFHKRLNEIFKDGNPTKALIIDAYIKTNPTSQMELGQSLPIDSVSKKDHEEALKIEYDKGYHKGTQVGGDPF